MPVRGEAPFIMEALKSVTDQREVDLELICIDDGIAGPTLSLIQDFGLQFKGVRIVVNRGRGIVDALNTGLEFARGEFIARMDSDDVCVAGRFAAQIAFLRGHPDVGVLGTQAHLIDGDGRVLRRLHVPVGSSRVHAALQVSCALIHPTVMLRQSVLGRAGGYRQGFDGAEDFELWLRLRRFTQLDNLPTPLLLYRRHQNQVTMSKQFHQARMTAVATVGDLLSLELGFDCLAAPGAAGHWRTAFRNVRATALQEVSALTACSLADNGGTLRGPGAKYLRNVCKIAMARRLSGLYSRLALACVRHQVSLVRSGRWPEALVCMAADARRWRTKLLRAYYVQASALWRSRLLPD